VSTFPSPQAPPFAMPRRQRSHTGTLILCTLLALVAAGMLWSCGRGAYHYYRLSSAAVAQFHQQLDQADYETIWGDATDAFRQTGSRADGIKFLQNIHEKMGNSGKMSAKGFHINWQNRRVGVSQVFETQFALGTGQESFIWIIEQDQPRLQSYRVDSPNLR
jgi:hypothetical protein